MSRAENGRRRLSQKVCGKTVQVTIFAVERGQYRDQKQHMRRVGDKTDRPPPPPSYPFLTDKACPKMQTYPSAPSRVWQTESGWSVAGLPPRHLSVAVHPRLLCRTGNASSALPCSGWEQRIRGLERHGVDGGLRGPPEHRRGGGQEAEEDFQKWCPQRFWGRVWRLQNRWQRLGGGRGGGGAE